MKKNKFATSDRERSLRRPEGEKGKKNDAGRLTRWSSLCRRFTTGRKRVVDDPECRKLRTKKRR